MLTYDEFVALPAFELFAHGMTNDKPGGLNIMGTGKSICWVAVKGKINDWAMYCGWSNNIEHLMQFGDKVLDKTNITNVLKVDEQVLNCYRY